MPTIPKYNQGATEEAGLTRAKKRVIGYMEQGILKLTEKPAYDLTNGKADVLAEAIIKQMEETASILRQGNLLFEEMDDAVVVDNFEDAKKILKLVVVARKFAIRLNRDLKKLLRGISYIDLAIFADLQTAWKELGSVFDVSATYLTNIDIELVGDEEEEQRWAERLEREARRVLEEIDEDEREVQEQFADMMDDAEEEDIQRGIDRRNRTQENFQRIPNFETLVTELIQLFYSMGELMMGMRVNFNQARQQKVSAPEQVPDEASGSGFRKPLYRVGNNVMSAMYELDGLPRYI
jgi:hypothetical protein